MFLSALLSLSVFAAPLPAPQDTGPPPDAYQTLIAEHDASELGYAEKYQAFRSRFLELAETAKDPDVAVRARLWLFGQAWWERQEGTMAATAKAQLDRILQDHAASPRLAEIMDSAYVLGSDERIPLFRKIHQLTPHDEVKAAALLGIGVAASRSKDERSKKAAARALTRLSEEYGELPYKASTYGAMAHAYQNIHPREALEIGQTAPEITGADLDGKPMKLSDYRGKVVVLDFWGHW